MSKRESKSIRWGSEKMKKKRKSSMKMKSAALSSCPGECPWEQKMMKKKKQRFEEEQGSGRSCWPFLYVLPQRPIKRKESFATLRLLRAERSRTRKEAKR